MCGLIYRTIEFQKIFFVVKIAPLYYIFTNWKKIIQCPLQQKAREEAHKNSIQSSGINVVCRNTDWLLSQMRQLSPSRIIPCVAAKKEVNSRAKAIMQCKLSATPSSARVLLWKGKKSSIPMEFFATIIQTALAKTNSNAAYHSICQQKQHRHPQLLKFGADNWRWCGRTKGATTPNYGLLCGRASMKLGFVATRSCCQFPFYAQTVRNKRPPFEPKAAARRLLTCWSIILCFNKNCAV